jgi:hypothetical protein
MSVAKISESEKSVILAARKCLAKAFNKVPAENAGALIGLRAGMRVSKKFGGCPTATRVTGRFGPRASKLATQ